MTKNSQLKKACSALSVAALGLLAAPWSSRHVIAEDAVPTPAANGAPADGVPTEAPPAPTADASSDSGNDVTLGSEKPATKSSKAIDVSSDQDRNAAASRLQATGADVASSGGSGTNLDQYMVAKTSNRFVGKPISLHVRDVDAADVFRLIGEASGFNIILGDDVKGKLTLSMTEVPWDQALDVVLHTLRLGAERNNNILRITTLNNLTSEKMEQLRAQRAAEDSAPRITKVFPINYAKLPDLQKTLQTFVSSGAQTASNGPSGSSPVVQIDDRTNSLIVRDLPENIERMRKLIEILDTQTPQVMVEAKVIEATETFSKTMGGNLGLGKAGDTGYFGSFNSANPLDQLVGSVSTGTTIGTTTANAGGFGFSFLTSLARVNATLNMGETDSQLKVIASPKLVLLNKAKASIIQSTPVAVPTPVTTTNGGVGTGFTVMPANLSLTVTPTVTNEGGVLMDLQVTRDIPQDAGGGFTGIGNRNINSTVLVESGTTLVIGGIYTNTKDKGSSGFPFLRRLPVIGTFFGNEKETDNRSELFIFITPRILNIKEAGLSG